MVVSQHVTEMALKKEMCLRLFLKLMHSRDDRGNDLINLDIHAEKLAVQAGNLLGVSSSFVYKVYKEWRCGQEERAIKKMAENKICCAFLA